MRASSGVVCSATVYRADRLASQRQLAPYRRSAGQGLRPVEVGLSRRGSICSTGGSTRNTRAACSPSSAAIRSTSPTGSSARRRTRVTATGGLFRFNDGTREVVDHVYATFEYPGGRTAVFSSIESNAFDNYYEAFFGTKGTLILKGEAEAFLFDEAGSRAVTGVEVTPQSAGPALEASESRVADAAGGVQSASGQRVDRLLAYRHADLGLLRGRARRPAPGVRARSRRAFGRGVHPRGRGRPAEDAAFGVDARADVAARAHRLRLPPALLHHRHRRPSCPLPDQPRPAIAPSRSSCITRSAMRSCAATCARVSG